MAMLSTLLIGALLAVSSADMYLQNMRGSNNRLDEARRDRDNANRLFDSQNNNRGGYNVGGMYFYEGEVLPIEWTQQHGCGSEWSDCQIVVQMMCDNRTRDGATTQTIPQNPTNCANNDCNNDVRFGMHEDYDYYTNCRYRFRNRGLFTADRNLNGNTAIYTRQNNDGTRRGYECPEERDHYPYWHPSPWIDVMMLTNDATRCAYYQNTSENVVGRGFCWMPDDYYHMMVGNGGNGNQGFIPNTPQTCAALNAPTSNMMRFLRVRLQAQFNAFQAQVVAETRRCNTAWSTCVLQGTSTGAAGAAACSANFTANSMTQAQLDSVCSPCNVTDGSFVPHPSPRCPTCVVARCLASYIPEINGTCPQGYIEDPSSLNYCVTPDCAGTVPGNLQSLDRMRAVDACRGSVLQTKYLVNSSSTATSLCLTRTIMSSDCFFADVPQARWVTARSHRERYAGVFDVPPPRCTAAPFSRHNHLGNGIVLEGYTNFFNHTFWPIYHNHCVFRIRYNITTTDYGGLDPMNPGEVNSTLNRNANGGGDSGARIDLRKYYGLPLENGAKPYENDRGYLFDQNPQVQIFDLYRKFYFCQNGPDFEIPSNPSRCLRTRTSTTTDTVAASSGYCGPLAPLKIYQGTTMRCANADNSTVVAPTNTDQDFKLQLAINTNQFGRTFQDRSHVFQVRPRSDELKAKCPNDIYALNVRGKRGNIVQTFPGTEYDFTPDRLEISQNDCIHIQWTGSNTNPNNNDGQGQAGSDRHNIAQMEYVRGEGGRGVTGFGGKGAGGTTWTTKDMKPGWEGWRFQASPSMMDVQCPRPLAAHRYNWRKCVTQPCSWAARGCTTNNNGVITCLPCPAGFVEDAGQATPSQAMFCISATCTISDRPNNQATWVSGIDPILGALSPNYTQSQIGLPDMLKAGTWGVSHPEHLDNVTFLGLDRVTLTALAILNNRQLGGELSELDDAGTYFDLDPVVATRIGTYHYMCTRNNNFSNRSQKAKITVSEKKATTSLIGQSGGTVGMSTAGTFTGVLTTDLQRRINNDFWVQVPEGCLSGANPVTMSVSPATSAGVSPASDFVFLGPSNLVCQRPLQNFRLLPPATGTRRRAITSDELWGNLVVINGSAITYRIWAASSGLRDFYNTFTTQNPSFGDPMFTVQFSTAEDGVVATVANLTLDGIWSITGTWTNVDEKLILAAENGKLWLNLIFDPRAGGSSLTGLAVPVDPTAKFMTVRIPVSVSDNYGKVYWLPDTPLGRACVQGTQTSTCSLIRAEVGDATVSNGEAIFKVGGSQTQPAGGFYYVSEGSNIAIIIGVSAMCFVIAVAVVGSAVYFRKHPDKWETVKLWGPRKCKSIKRSLASHV
jgi:hypothetical protein